MGGESRPAPHEERVETLTAAFERQFGRPPEGISEAPGRVNLIGEHVDYNDGLVLPFAIDRSVMCAWARADRIGTVFVTADGLDPARDATSVFRSEAVEFDQVTHGDWMDYPRAVLWALVAAGQVPEQSPGFLTLISGDVPQGAGLSSSAALEVAVEGAFRDAFSLPIDDVELARLCQRAENEYVGVQCGIMDQFASALSKRDHALLIDCRTLAYEHVPLRLTHAGYSVVIANSGVKRELASSAYNERRRECGEAVPILRERLGRPDLASLRDVTATDLDVVLDEDRAEGRGLKARAGDIEGADMEIDSVLLRRARHVVTEIARVAAAVEALRHDDFAELGRLMGESHLSLRDDYQVSSPQLDLLVGLATAQEYVAGARLTGAGFGGCTVNLVRADAVDAFERDVIAPYRERTGLPAEMYVTSPQDGLRTWRL